MKLLYVLLILTLTILKLSFGQYLLSIDYEDDCETIQTYTVQLTNQCFKGSIYKCSEDLSTLTIDTYLYSNCAGYISSTITQPTTNGKCVQFSSTICTPQIELPKINSNYLTNTIYNNSDCSNTANTITYIQGITDFCDSGFKYECNENQFTQIKYDTFSCIDQGNSTVSYQLPITQCYTGYDNLHSQYTCTVSFSN